MKKILSLDIKYSGIQILYYIAWSGILGYASVYLLDKGFSNSVIGTVLAIISMLSLVLQPIAGSFVDQSQHIKARELAMILIAISVVFSICLYFLKEASLLLLLLFIGIASALYTILPLLNSMAFIFEKYNIAINFGLARGLGSAAYAIASILLGYLVEDVGASVLPLVYGSFNVLLIILTYSFVVPKSERKQIVEEEEEVHNELTLIEFAKKYKKFVAFIIGSVLVYSSLSFLNNFFIQVITPIGGTESDMGTAVFIAAMLELPAMAMFTRFSEKFGCVKLIRLSTIMFIVKACITAIAPNMAIIYVAQCFQLLSYAILTPGSTYYANMVVSEADRTKGQSLVSMGIAGSSIIASLAGGALIDMIGVKTVLYIGVILSAIGAVIVNASLEKNIK